MKKKKKDRSLGSDETFEEHLEQLPSKNKGRNRPGEKPKTVSFIQNRYVEESTRDQAKVNSNEHLTAPDGSPGIKSRIHRQQTSVDNIEASGFND